MILTVTGCATDAPNVPQGPVRLGETFDVGGIRITPLAVLEDSRCPEGVQCIQAGTVRVKTRLEYGRASKEVVYELWTTSGNPFCIGLTYVTPGRTSTTPSGTLPYRFTFADDESGNCEVEVLRRLTR